MPCAIGDTLRSDETAEFGRETRLDAGALPPLVTWGTNPEQVSSITGSVPRPEEIMYETKRAAARRALAYMGLKGGETATARRHHENRRNRRSTPHSAE